MEWWYRLRYWGSYPTRMRLRRDAQQYLQSTTHCRDTQAAVLRNLLELHADSHFSREYGLTGNLGPKLFRARLPVVTDEFYRPWIEKLRQGDMRALLGTSQRLLMFALTSGTTAESKYIPITEQFLNDYRRGWQIWGIHTFDDHPILHRLNILQLSSDHDQFRTPAGTSCGNISGLVGSMQSRTVKLMYTLPTEISTIHAADAKYYTALRLAIADDHVGVIMTANPSTLLRLARLADTYKESLIRDLHDGTLTGPTSTTEDSKAVQEILERNGLSRQIGCKNRVRAHELERIVQRTGTLYPKDIWSKLQLLAVWTGGSAGAYLHQLKSYYGDIPVRDHGLSASEGRMTIPLADNTSAGLLDIGTHYFEFIPEEEHGQPQPTVLEAHELNEGRNYYIILTTASGLYRYDIQDVVRCVGYLGTTPYLEFLHKGTQISSITGEKISESQVISAVKWGFEQLGCPLELYAIAPQWGDPPGYRLLMESRHVPSAEVTVQIVQHVDHRLQELNSEYREKRQTARLNPIRCLSLTDGTWARFIAERHAKMKGNVEQYKHPCLFTDLRSIEQLIGETSPSHQD
ncbi:MAG: GH3 auxin-responsive promoter family protein [Planctomycetota bacterium]|nr:GH3 auxin-responsive promoter family protein [Planctomycetota bacterium]MDA1211113.1 GH3 auxin-responsive promoter family protein [Planctomycetota bacterium]